MWVHSCSIAECSTTFIEIIISGLTCGQLTEEEEAQKDYFTCVFAEPWATHTKTKCSEVGVDHSRPSRRQTWHGGGWHVKVAARCGRTSLMAMVLAHRQCWKNILLDSVLWVWYCLIVLFVALCVCVCVCVTVCVCTVCDVSVCVCVCLV